MIVENKEATLQKANQISDNLLKTIITACEISSLPDDPAEHVYLISHTIGSLMAKICVVIREYGKTYGIPRLHAETTHDWIVEITKELIKANSNDR